MPSRPCRLRTRLPVTALMLSMSGCFTPPPGMPGDGGSDGREALATALESCVYIGGLTRYGVRAEAEGMCATLMLVDGPGAPHAGAPDLSVPPELGVEAFSLAQGPCAGRAWRVHEPGRAPSGTVSAAPSAHFPSEFAVDVSFPTGLERPERVRLLGTVELTGPSCF